MTDISRIEWKDSHNRLLILIIVTTVFRSTHEVAIKLRSTVWHPSVTLSAPLHISKHMQYQHNYMTVTLYIRPTLYLDKSLVGGFNSTSYATVVGGFNSTSDATVVDGFNSTSDATVVGGFNSTSDATVVANKDSHVLGKSRTVC